MSIPKLSMSNPVHTRATMARNGFAPGQLTPYWDADTDRDLDPLDDAETRSDVRKFMAALWNACLDAESAPTPTNRREENP